MVETRTRSPARLLLVDEDYIHTLGEDHLANTGDDTGDGTGDETGDDK